MEGKEHPKTTEKWQQTLQKITIDKSLEATVNVARNDCGQHFNSTAASIFTLKRAKTRPSF